MVFSMTEHHVPKNMWYVVIEFYQCSPYLHLADSSALENIVKRRLSHIPCIPSLVDGDA
jgi:hypothetical protein